MTQWVYGFSEYQIKDSLSTKDLLGGKGSGLVEMTQLGLPVPPGFILSTPVCTFFYQNQEAYPEGLQDQVLAALKQIEIQAGEGMALGSAENPLLISVRSGAKASMPGMMDTILNLGLNDTTVECLKKLSGDARFAYDSYRRFIQMYSNVVLGLSLHPFEEILNQYKAVRKVTEDHELCAEDLHDIIEAYKAKIFQISGSSFPQDVYAQLWGAIKAVLRSWMNPRAIAYRSFYHIPEDWGTAVIIQAMVFGNQGNESATGVAFTRHPSTGEKLFFGEYLLNAQGEDVVAGIRTPEPLTIQQKRSEKEKALEELMPEAYQELAQLKDTLEKHYRDMQDIEFTIQKGKLWLLQTRNGKRTAPASLRIVLSLVEEGLITQEEALCRVEPLGLNQLLHPQLAPSQTLNLLGKGLPASPGAAVGRVVFTANACAALAEQGEPVILVREETSPEDIHGMTVAQGILTARGGMTSHAAVVARGMGRPCIVGAENLHIDFSNQTFSFNGFKLKAGDTLTFNGSTGEVFQGEGRLEKPELSSGDFSAFMQWADGTRRLRVRANAETPQDITTALHFGAEGIGLCRTEHMFFEASRILAVREMILAESPEERKRSLQKILPMQREDFQGLFRLMGELPITVRLLDPPLHEFLPRSEGELEQLARSLQKSTTVVRQRVSELQEANPMLGHRGCRLGITSPEIYEMQVQALLEASLATIQQTGLPLNLEIMMPLVALTGELRFLRERIEAVAQRVRATTQLPLTYSLGTMIELPRAALKADKIAMLADFISFGTNDLTQTTFGLSRDDAASFLEVYRQKGILDRDPFVSLDQSGVGELIALAVQKARAAKPNIKLGICGEHGGDPKSIAYFEEIKLDYISCSPYRLPIARLAAAQAAVCKLS
ncbi:MAG: pyruvate, phosphate dikinase [Alphaproteobacteria bacterium]